jgi:hypothetical protein
LGGGSLCLILQGVVFRENKTERGGQVVVDLLQKGLSVVKSFYNVMGCHDGFHFPWKSVLRVAFFGWLAALERIFTMVNL